jgi:hypothetical protein
MNAYAMIVASEALRLADERLDGYRQETARHRLAARAAKPSRIASIVSAVSSLRAALSAVETDNSTPSLINYPYRA